MKHPSCRQPVPLPPPATPCRLCNITHSVTHPPFPSDAAQATHHGLTKAEHKLRLAEYGPNKLPESGRNMILVFLGYMWNPLSWAMEAAAIIAICLNDWADFALIVGLLIMNSCISYVEEANADKAIKVSWKRRLGG
jgi:magnesium-transporting ATPase (P-type)